MQFVEQSCRQEYRIGYIAKSCWCLFMYRFTSMKKGLLCSKLSVCMGKPREWVEILKLHVCRLVQFCTTTIERNNSVFSMLRTRVMCACLSTRFISLISMCQCQHCSRSDHYTDTCLLKTVCVNNLVWLRTVYQQRSHEGCVDIGETQEFTLRDTF